MRLTAIFVFLVFCLTTTGDDLEKTRKKNLKRK